MFVLQSATLLPFNVALNSGTPSTPCQSSRDPLLAEAAGVYMHSLILHCASFQGGGLDLPALSASILLIAYLDISDYQKRTTSHKDYYLQSMAS